MNYKRPLGALGFASFLAILCWLAIRYEHRSPSKPTSLAASNASTAGPREVLELKSLAQPATAAAVLNTPALPRPEQRVEPDAAREPAFTAFEQWLRRFEQADGLTKGALEAEGKILAQARQTAFADMVQTNAERALQLALAPAQRTGLPESIGALLEKPINGVGDVAVLATLPFGSATTKLPAVFRTATIDGEQYHAFTFGNGRSFLTRKDVPLNGYAVPVSTATRVPENPLAQAPNLLLLDPHPVRPLARTEIEEIKRRRVANAAATEPVCAISGQDWLVTKTETAGEVGGTIVTFCGPAHLRLWEEQAIAAAGLTTPNGGAKSLATAESSYTEGRKRMLLMRPYWTDQAVAMTTNAAITHFLNFSNYMWQMSYGKLRFAALGQGSEISTELLIPGNVNSYVAGLGNGATEAWRATRDVAQTNYGYDLSKYDFLYYVTTDKPAASYCGLGFVGGVGFHLANSCFDAAVSSHEYGHNLGLNHASFWDTSLASIIGSGQREEYGDGNDPMGGGGNPNQYNSRYKNYLGWITNADIATIPATGSNRYRLYCFDLDYGVGLRGLQFARSGSQNYWINFRQRKTGAANAALVNGAQLIWTANGNDNSELLDVRLRGSAANNAVVIGRTFSDPNLNFHFTPIGKGNTYPESLDIITFTGTQLGNLPPISNPSANILNPSAGQAVTFSANASDPNGDTLAYYWEFGDGAESYSADNRSAQVHSFASAGEYAVRCVVSDMRGGTVQHTLTVRVGSPSLFRISGHVTDQYSRPMAGARITSGSRIVFSDSDGSYVIPNHGAGNYTVSAIEPLRGAVELVHPFFNNPVVLGPDAQHIDFMVGTSAPPITLVATGATWKYIDDGSDQGTAWQAPGFVDTPWKSGASELGYGENDETTRIEDNATPGYVSTDTDRYITSYFRHSFNVATPSSLTNLVLNLFRDDGAIVYLNGTEVFRSNMPTGAVTYLTAALVAETEPLPWFTTNLSSSLFVPGVNVFAVEIHQQSSSSSDVSFNFFLTAEAVNNVSRGSIVYVDSPADNAVFYSPTNLTVVASAYGTPVSVTNVQIFDGVALLGSAAAPPYSVPLNNPTDGLHVLRAVSADANGLRRTSAPVNITITAPPPVAIGAVWSYFHTNFAAPNGWQNPGFDDSGWNSGAARIGFNATTNDLATAIDGGPANDRYRTAYFRRAFTMNDPGGVTNLTMQLARDDGAVVYLNGVEILRNNIQNGVAPSYSLLASNAADNGATYSTFTVPTDALRHGTNILAAEVHQSAANSSDLLFDLGLNPLASTNRSRGCWIASPTNGGSILLPGNSTLTAHVVAGSDLGVTNVEFYSDGVKIGEDASFPFTFVWINPSAGLHSLVAVGYDSAGAAITSAPVNVTAVGPPNGDALISFGDLWKYLDDGSDAGTVWRTSLYNDNQWMMGPARLGYGGDGELTTVSYGTNASAKYITTYFRKKFFVPTLPATFSGLLLRLVRDDGAIVYLNGTEIFRTNLLPGPISYNSLAISAIGGADETTPIDVLLSTAGLVGGSNTLAVEMHQDSLTSSDLGFDLALVGLRNTNNSGGVYFTSPAGNSHYNMPGTIPLSAYASSSPGTVTLVEFFDGGVKVGQATTAPYSANWSGASAGSHTLTAVATYSGGLQITSPAIAVVVGPAPAPIAPTYAPFINWGSQWKYWDSAGAVSNGWQGLEFDDNGWPAGSGRFGWGLDGEATLLTPRITHYFRKSFVVTNGGAFDSLTFNVLRDDGVIVYLNGAEVFRTNMPAGAVTGSTLTPTTNSAPEETIPVIYSLPTLGASLLYGTNVVAAELHQFSINDSDGGFDLSLYGEGTTEPRIYLGSPANNSIQIAGLPIRLEANAQAASGRTLTAVEFFGDGTNVGQATALPYRFNWSGASTGSHTIVARSLDNFGAALTSAPVQISVGYEKVSLVLVPAGAIWKYLDDGSNQGINWSQTNFNDASWEYGPAELGYGDLPEGRPEATVLCCSNAAVKFITYYFRHSFVVPPETFYTNLIFRLLRDDGAVVYLNGREMYRSNMPNGTILFSTPASQAASSSDETTYFATSIKTNLFPGTNLVAVEVHQSGTTSSDVSFDLQLDGIGYVLNAARPSLVAENLGGQLRVAWPTSATGYQLYWCPQLGSAWQLVGGSPTITNGFNVMIIPTTNAAAFYRLGK